MTHSLRVYYTASIRGGKAATVNIKSQINTLRNLGFTVLTEHMAKDADMGLSDREIYNFDQELLNSAHFVVAECSNPSLGVGFMIGQAVSKQLPTFCLIQSGLNLSAMISGCPRVYVDSYTTDDDFGQVVCQLLLMCHSKISTLPDYKPLVVYLFGAPGAGKSTVAKYISQKYNLVNISTGEMLREIVKHNTGESVNTIVKYINDGKLIPPELMVSLVVPRLKKADCQTFGFILDGYPCTQAERDYLAKEAITPDVVFYFQCSDDVAIQRQCSRGERSTDIPEKAKARISTFHQMPTIETLRKEWYSNVPVIAINAELDKEIVTECISNTVNTLKTRPNHSYMPIEFMPTAQTNQKNSTRFHLHIDGKSHDNIRHIYWQVMAKYPQAQGHFKIYPIRRLELGPQIHTYQDTYRQMCNFHPITEQTCVSEAFLTGCMGDDFDPKMMTAVLDTIHKQQDTYMTEIEQYIFEQTLEADGRVTTQTRYDPKSVDITGLGYTQQLNPMVPKAELHLGFDLPLSSKGEVPIPVNTLMNACTECGFENGGWFIFGYTKASYRSNQFTQNTNIEECEQILVKQAHQLQKILASLGYPNVPISFSYEYVHGIWQF
jgi:adenylate kinase family enzyme